MKEFFEKNKIFISIIIAGLLITGTIYFTSLPILNNNTQPTKKELDLDKSKSQSNSKFVNCINYRDANNYIGEYKCITGKVDNVYISSKGNIFINFCPNYKTCSFSAVIFSFDAYKFSNIKSYSGKTVEITGLIKTYQGRPEIIIDNPSQIKIK
jgi:micrococcal nuclease